jgi:hypothetical protein
MRHPAPAPIEPLEARIAPATFTVNTLADTGAGSFRQAILDANIAAGADSIVFDLPGTGLQLLLPASTLPAITDAVAITVTQTDSTEAVRIDGASAGTAAVGLRFVGTVDASATGIQVAHFSGDGIVLENTSITKLLRVQSFGNGGSGFHIIGGHHNIIQSSSAGIAAGIASSTGNAVHGLLVENSIQNLIGTGAELGSITESNTFNGNGTSGVTIVGGYENVFRGYDIKSNGATPVGSWQTGGLIVIDSSYNVFSGFYKLSAGFERSTYIGPLLRQISDNAGPGILMTGQSTFNNKLMYNLVMDNSEDGLRIEGGAHDLIIGDTISTTPPFDSYTRIEHVGNFFLRNDGWGVHMAGSGSNSKIVQGSADENSLGGMLVDGIQRVVIESNVINRNTGAGIAVTGSSQGIELVRNRFSDNTGLPFDLGADGVTANDTGDLDGGPNGLLNFPTFTPIVLIPGYWQGQVDTDRPNVQLRVEFYTYVAATQTYTYSSEQLVTTDANGDAILSLTTVPINTQQVARVSVKDGESSEFSAPISYLPFISLTPTTVDPVMEGNSGVKEVNFTVKLDAPSTLPVTVEYSALGVTATGGEDYAPVSGTLTFAPGVTEMPLTISVIGDNVKEATETFQLKLENPTAGRLSSAISATVTIVNDDAIPTVNIGGDVIAAEPAGTNGTYGTVQFTVSLSEASLDPVTVSVGVPSAPNFPERAYQVATGTITFLPGQTTSTGTLNVIRDSVSEPDQIIQLTLSNPTKATLGDSQGSVTIVDDDSWGLSIGDVTISEGDNGTAIAHVPVTISALVPSPFARLIEFDYTTQNQTATAGSDYTATSGHLSFANGPATTTIDIPVSGDLDFEADEMFRLLAQNVLGARVLHQSAITITNDDIMPPAISIGDVTFVEGDGGTANAVFTVSLGTAGSQAISVHYQTANGTATAGSDYTSTSGDLFFPVGTTTLTVSVPIIGDFTPEENETFLVQLSNPLHATLADDTAVGTITNDDPTPPGISIGDVMLVEGDGGLANAVFTVSLGSASNQAISVHYETANGTATADNDYTATSGDLLFPAGTTSLTVSVPIIGDFLPESHETFLVQLSNPLHATLADHTAVGTITNNDASITIGDITFVEGDSGTSNAILTVTLSGPLTNPVSVNYTTAPGTALAGQDYITSSGQLVFAPGETSKSIAVAVIGDLTAETAESFSLTLSDAAGAVVTDSEGVATITDTDLPGPRLTISVNHKVARWHDVDGDLVTLRSNRPVLYPDSFAFTSMAAGGQLTHFQPIKATAGVPIDLSFTAAKTSGFPDGDGVVNVGAIDIFQDFATGIVAIDGDLGRISAGNISKLDVGSFGALGLATQGGVGRLDSGFAKAGTILVRGEWAESSLTASSIAKIKALGGIRGQSANLGAPQPGIHVVGKLGNVVVVGDILGVSAEKPFLIKSNGNHPGKSASGSMALDSLTVTGDVVNVSILAGTSQDLFGQARIGTVAVAGNWTASSLAAGATAGADGFFGTADDIVASGLFSRIASITITGTVSGSANPGDNFGFVSQKIQKISIGGTPLPLNPHTVDTIPLAPDVFVREVA